MPDGCVILINHQLLSDQSILRTDISGMPLEWIGFKRAVTLKVLGQIAYTCGDFVLKFLGGVNRIENKRSEVEINSIISTYGHFRGCNGTSGYYPPLHNIPLFQRDAYVCMYCGENFPARELSRDHVTPLLHGGLDHWNNVVTACVRCNNFKASRTPEEANMKLVAIPFTPTRAEYIFLQGRKVLLDQMGFLKAHFPRTSPLHERIQHKYN